MQGRSHHLTMSPRPSLLFLPSAPVSSKASSAQLTKSRHCIRHSLPTKHDTLPSHSSFHYKRPRASSPTHSPRSATKASLAFNTHGSPDILIIGGGFAGLSAAHHLALRGIRATVIDGNSFRAGAASGAAAGLLAVNAEGLKRDGGIMAKAGNVSRGMYGDWVEEIGGDVGYRCGEMVRASFEKGESDEDKWMEGSALRDLVPGLAEEVVGGFVLKGDGQVDVRKLWIRLRIACERLGVNIVEGNVERILMDAKGERVEKVVVGNWMGESVSVVKNVSAGHYLIAAGSWTGKIVPWIPVTPVKGQMVSVEWDGTGLDRILFGDEVYMVPKVAGNKKVVYVGATVEPSAEFDTEVTTGGVRSLLNSAVRLMPSIDSARLVESWAGLRPSTPDRKPIVGNVLRNCSICTGQYRNGVLFAPLLGDIAANVAIGSPVRDEWLDIVNDFSVDRFSSFSSESQAGRRPIPHKAQSSPRIRGFESEVERDSKATAVGNASREEDSFNQSEIKVWHVQSDGSKVPVKYKEPPAVFQVGYGDTTGSAEQYDGKMGPFDWDPAAYDDEYVDPSVELNGRPSHYVEENFEMEKANTQQQAERGNENVRPQPPKRLRSTNSNDAYDDILQFRGPDADRIRKEAMAKNLAFGVTPEMKAAEMAAFEKAFEEGMQESEEVLRKMSDDNDPGKLATARELGRPGETATSNGAVR